jgi:serine/threonine protein kinase
LRSPLLLFEDLLGSNPAATVSSMCDTLGALPLKWRTFPFHDGYPVHEPIQPDDDYETFEHMEGPCTFPLEEDVAEILEPQRPEDDAESKSEGIRKLCLPVPSFNWNYLREDFEKEFLKPIQREDAVLFADLLRKIFDYDHHTRFTASQVLEHPWLRGDGEGDEEYGSEGKGEAEGETAREEEIS